MNIILLQIGDGQLSTILIFSLLSLVIYTFPAIVACLRGHPKKVWIILLNIFLGWTVLGWIALLVWSFMASIEIPRRRHKANL